MERSLLRINRRLSGASSYEYGSTHSPGASRKTSAACFICPEYQSYRAQYMMHDTHALVYLFRSLLPPRITSELVPLPAQQLRCQFSRS